MVYGLRPRWTCCAVGLCAFGLGSLWGQVDYPHVTLTTEGLTAPECNDVPKLLIGGAHSCSSQETQTWLSELRSWRSNRRIRMGYSDEMYKVPELQWTQSSFIQPQMMMEDRYFYDPLAGR